MTNHHDQPDADALCDLGALGGRLETNEKLQAAVTRAEDNLYAFLNVAAELVRVGAEDPSAVPRLLVRLDTHAGEIAAAVTQTRAAALRLARSSEGQLEHVETLLLSTAASLKVMSQLAEGLGEIEDLELRRLASVMVERNHGLRLAVAKTERYVKAVYGEGK